MKKEQALGQLRALLTACGTVLATWGFTDGHQWQPVVGVIMVLYSLTWGLLHHKDPSKPGSLSWSLVRKAVNIIGTALVTYGFVSPEKIESLVPLVAALGPILASMFSFIGNDDGKKSPPPGGMVLPLFILPMLLFLPGCSTPAEIRFTPDGCVMAGQKVPGYPNMVWFGACNDNRWAAEWTVEQLDGATLQTVRLEYNTVSEETRFLYLTEEGWIEWSSKSGIVIGPVPEPVLVELPEEIQPRLE